VSVVLRVKGYFFSRK